MCEWKGAATYHNLTLNSSNETVKAKIWSYASPTLRFREIKDYLCFYASGVPWTCYVDGEKVKPQEGEFAILSFEPEAEGCGLLACVKEKLADCVAVR